MAGRERRVGQDPQQRKAVTPADHAGSRSRGRFADLVRNVAVLGGLWALYWVVRSVTRNDTYSAFNNALELWDWQQQLGLPNEAFIQRIFLSYPTLIRAANRYYLWVHFPLTALFLAGIWLRHHHYVALVRATLVSVTLTALGLHLVFPLAPPRFLANEGFIDTGRFFGPSPYDLSVASTANQFAAMPSLHVAWALLLAIGVIAVSTSRWRYLAIVHPVITFYVVLVTANHYWTDGFVAIALVGVAWWVAQYYYDPEPRTVGASAT